MGNQNDTRSIISNLFNFFAASSDEPNVAHREDLVNQQHIRLSVDSDGESQSNVHTTTVGLHRRVQDIRIQTGEFDDLIEFTVDLTSIHAENRAVDVDILPAGQHRM